MYGVTANNRIRLSRFSDPCSENRILKILICRTLMTVKIDDNIRTKRRQWVNEETYSKTKIIKRKVKFFPVCERTWWLQRSSRGCWEVNWCMKIARKVAGFENTPLGCRRSIALRVSVKKSTVSIGWGERTLVAWKGGRQLLSTVNWE